MQLLTKGENIIGFGDSITYGIFDEDFPKWKVLLNNVITYHIDMEKEYKVIDNIDNMPKDYRRGKYFFVDGKFILNPNWKPFLTQEQRLLNAENSIITIEDAMCETEVYSDERISAIEDALCELSTLLEL